VSGSNPILNGYDANALEEALRLKEKYGAVVTALCLGGDQAKAVLRRALAMGADKAVLVTGDAGISGDAVVTAQLLSAAIRSFGAVRLVLAGRSASDTDAGVVAPLIAGSLGLPMLTPVRSIATTEDGSLLVERITDSGCRRFRVCGPAILGVSNEANKPRTPQLKGVAAAKRASIPTLTSLDLGISVRPAALRIRRLFVPQVVIATTEIIAAGSPAEAGRLLADRLCAEALV
jgi:electron transfer flavoprotein beta subunit